MPDSGSPITAIEELAATVFGSRCVAEKWLSEPAIGLEGRKRPIELLDSNEGREVVWTYLLRMYHGVYC